MLIPGQSIELTIEKPAAGGRMLARHDGQVVLVSGAIPGERVRARLQRVERRLAFAESVEILSPSHDRRDAYADPACGGCVYSHIQYERQLQLKAEIVADAFARLGHLPLEHPLTVAASPEEGYRLRARLHTAGARVGFYREGSHDLCDPRGTRQLRDATVAAAEDLASALSDAGIRAHAIEITENVEGTRRAGAVSVSGEAGSALKAARRVVDAGSLDGCILRDEAGQTGTIGEPLVTDPIAVLTRGAAAAGTLSRSPESFFQANRFLLPDLVGAVVGAVHEDGEVVDLYAGVGLFSICLAALGRRGIHAVEGDRSAGADLLRNASQFEQAVSVTIGAVEDHLDVGRPETVIVDPPRTGMSKAAAAALAQLGARRIVYVSCDPATMARDARRLADAGYRLTSLRAFDLFPNTPHVETVGVFDRI